MNGTQALDRLIQAYDNRLEEARTRKSKGATLVTYFLNSVPVELIVAAGLDCVRLVGSPDGQSPLADTYMEEYMDGEVRSLFGSILDGKLSFADLLIIPRTSEVYLQLYYFLLEMRKWEPDRPVPPLWLFDLLQAPTWSTLNYDLKSLRKLADQLKAIGGQSVDETSLARAIALINRLRQAVRSAVKLARESRLSGGETLKLIGAASVLPPDGAIEALESLTADPPAHIDHRGVRVLLKGSPQSDPRVTELIESYGGHVVAHDHIAGETSFLFDVCEEGDPWEALAGYYQTQIPGPRVQPQAEQDSRFIKLVHEAQAEAVIFFHDEWDDTLGWEYPDQRRLLEDAGIPSLFLKRQPYFDPPVADQSRAIASFLSDVKNGAVK